MLIFALPTRRWLATLTLLLIVLLLADTPGALARPSSGESLSPVECSVPSCLPGEKLSAECSASSCPRDEKLLAAASGWSQIGPAGDLPAVRTIVMDGPALAEGTQIIIATGNGVYRSINGGATWNDWSESLPDRSIAALLRGLDGSFYAAAGGLVFRRSRDDAAWSAFGEGLPSAPGVVSCLAANSAGVLFAADCAAATAGPRPVFRRAPGDTGWVAFDTGLPASRQISGLAVGASRVYLSLRDGNDIYASPTDSLGWVRVTAALPLDANDVTTLLVGPDDILYAGLSRRLANPSSKGGVARLMPGASDWESLNGGTLDGQIGSGLNGVDVRALAAAPGGLIFVLGGDGGLYSGGGTSEGISWTKGGQVDAPLTLALSPSAVASPPDNVLFVGVQAGLLRSQNLGRSFSPLNQGLARTLDVGELVFARDGTLFATDSSRAYRSSDDGASWTTILDLDAERISTLAPSADYGLDGALFVAATAATGPIFAHSTDRGATWVSGPFASLAAGAQVAALRSSPTIQADNMLYALVAGVVQEGSPAGVLRSTDRGVGWSSLTDGLGGQTLQAFAVAPVAGASLTLIAGSDAGVFSFDGSRWALLEGGAAPTDVRQIAFVPNVAGDDTFFAVGVGGLYRYRAEPAGWELVSSGPPNAPINALAVSPEFARDSTLLAATAGGVWVSRDAGRSWQAFSAGLPSLNISRLAFSPKFAGDRAVYAGSDSGIFKATLPPPAPDWLAMLYLAGDDSEPGDRESLLASLDEPLQLLLGRLDRMPYNPALRLVVLYDGPRPGDSRLYLRQPEGLEPVGLLPTWFPSDGELNSGSVSTLRNFISWSQETFPGSRHTLLSLVDHGGGWAPDFGDAAQPGARRRKQAGSWRGMSIDETSGGTSLSTRDTGNALEGLGPFDVVFFDACLMAMIESAYEIQPSAGYYIAGQNLLWADLPYDQYFAGDVLTTTTTPRELAQQIVAGYNLPRPGDSNAAAPEPFTIAALDLARLPDLRAKTNTLAERLLATLPAAGAVPLDNPVRLAITQAYSASQKFDYDVSLSLDPTDGYVDLADFAAQLQRPEHFISAEVSAAAAAVADAIVGQSTASGAVIATRTVSGTAQGLAAPWNFAGAHGLSIYLPLGEQDRRLSGPPATPGGPLTEQRQLDFYTNCNFSGCGQLAFTRDAPAWAQLLVRLEEGTPRRNLDDRPYQAPAPLSQPFAKAYLPTVIATNGGGLASGPFLP